MVTTDMLLAQTTAAGALPSTPSTQSDKAQPTAVSTPGQQDSVEISDTARSLYAQSVEEKKNTEVKAKQTSAEMAAKIKERLSGLATKKKSVTKRINELLEGANLKAGGTMKIEIDRDGKIVVGGLKDVENAARIEEALNADPKLAGRIKAYKNLEKEVNADIYKETGTSLYAIRREKIRFDMNEAEKAANNPEAGMLEYAASGHELFEDPEITSLINDVVGMGSVDFSSENKGVANPQSALNDLMNEARANIQAQLDAYNKHLEESGVDPMLLDSMKASLADVKISIDAEGNVRVEGRFSKSDNSNDKARAIVNKVVYDMVHEDEDLGMESLFHTAARQLAVNHDKEFGERAGVGKEALMTIDKGVVDVKVSAPGAIDQVKNDIRELAAESLSREFGFTVDAANVEVDDKGKITVRNLEGRVDEAVLRRTVDNLNKTVANLAVDSRAERPEAVSDSMAARAEKIAKLVNELSTYAPEPKQPGEGEEEEENEEREGLVLPEEMLRADPTLPDVEIDSAEFEALSEYEKNLIRDSAYAQWRREKD